MKQLTCEMCGSTELVKQDGYFVCQTCGCKYSVEEAKKMMIEGTVEVQGTVKIDDSKKITGYIKLAKDSLVDSDWDDVEKYGTLIIELDTQRVIGDALRIIAKFEKDLENNDYIDVAHCFSTLHMFSLENVFFGKMPEENKQECYDVIYQYLRSKFYSYGMTFFEKDDRQIEDWGRIVGDFKKFLRCMMVHYSPLEVFKIQAQIIWDVTDIVRLNAPYSTIEIIEEFLSQFENAYCISSDDEDELDEIFMPKNAIQYYWMCQTYGYVDSWSNLKNSNVLESKHQEKKLLSLCVRSLENILDTESSFQEIKNIFDKIYDENASGVLECFDEINSISDEVQNYKEWIDNIDEEIKQLLAEEDQEEDLLAETDQEEYSQNYNSTNTKSGCYVATCVYGSYDCPQVWTLRRFRDDTLGSTWYGRAFIKLYYAISPTLVKWFGKTKWFKKMWKGKLDRMVRKLNKKGVENTPYKDKNWK